MTCYGWRSADASRTSMAAETRPDGDTASVSNRLMCVLCQLPFVCGLCCVCCDVSGKPHFVSRAECSHSQAGCTFAWRCCVPVSVRNSGGPCEKQKWSTFAELFVRLKCHMDCAVHRRCQSFDRFQSQVWFVGIQQTGQVATVDAGSSLQFAE